MTPQRAGCAPNGAPRTRLAGESEGWPAGRGPVRRAGTGTCRRRTPAAASGSGAHGRAEGASAGWPSLWCLSLGHTRESHPRAREARGKRQGCRAPATSNVKIDSGFRATRGPGMATNEVRASRGERHPPATASPRCARVRFAPPFVPKGVRSVSSARRGSACISCRSRTGRGRCDRPWGPLER